MRHLLQVISEVPWTTIFHIHHTTHLTHTNVMDEEISTSNDPGMF